MVTENPLPIVNLGSDTTICVTESVLIDAGSGFAGYTWSTTETSQSITADGTTLGLGTHTITVEVSDSLGCTNTDGMVLTVDACAGISQEEIKHMEVYPNPTSNSIYVAMDQLTADALLTVYSTDGVRVLSVDITSELQEIDLSSLADGSYFLELETSNYRETIKVIKN